jgi:hypothetical protein
MQSPTVWPYSRTMPRALWWSCSEAVSPTPKPTQVRYSQGRRQLTELGAVCTRMGTNPGGISTRDACYWSTGVTCCLSLPLAAMSRLGFTVDEDYLLAYATLNSIHVFFSISLRIVYRRVFGADLSCVLSAAPRTCNLLSLPLSLAAMERLGFTAAGQQLVCKGNT